MTTLCRLLFPERIRIRVISAIQPASPSHSQLQVSLGQPPFRKLGNSAKYLFFWLFLRNRS